MRVFLLLLLALPALAVELSPTGLWTTIDDKTHRPRGTVRIYEENGFFFGKIESSFDRAEEAARCEKCLDDRKDKPILGLVIMRGLKKDGSEYTGGDIIDPDTGSLYRCRFTLSADGMKLSLRGYIGISLLGRTQVWIRKALNR